MEGRVEKLGKKKEEVEKDIGVVGEVVEGMGRDDGGGLKVEEEMGWYWWDEEMEKVGEEEVVEIIYEWEGL